MILRLILLIITIFYAGILSLNAEISSELSEEISYYLEEDFPICEKPYRAKLYSIVDNQLIIHIDEAARNDLFYYKIHVQGVNVTNTDIDTIYTIVNGHIQIVNDIRINEYLDVKVQRICFYGLAQIEIESEWIVLKSGLFSENRMSGDGGGIDCELFNGAEAQFHNGDWQVNLAGLLNFFSTGTVGGGSSSSGLDSLIVIFQYIDGRGDTITESFVVDPTWTQQDLRINLSNLFGFTGNESGKIIMEIGWWSNVNNRWVLCEGGDNIGSGY